MITKLPSILYISISLLALTTISFAQETTNYSYEFEFGTDNDNFIVYTATDQYYTYGINTTFRWKPKNENFISKIFPNKQSHYFSLGLNVKGYTPDYVDDNSEPNTGSERPFAGLSYLDFKTTYTFKKSFLRLGLDLGVLGPLAQVGDIQNWVHRNLTNDQEYDWSNQIPNQLGLNITASYAREFFHTGFLDSYGELNSSFGTIFNYLWPQINFRLGNFSPITSSITRKNSIQADKKSSEFFAEFGLGSKLSAYNATVQGNIFDRSARFDDLGINNFSYRMHLGVHYSKNRFSGTVRYLYSTGEIEKSQTHRYASIIVAYRFD